MQREPAAAAELPPMQMFPDWQYATQSSIEFCGANQRNIYSACTLGSDTGKHCAPSCSSSRPSLPC